MYNTVWTIINSSLRMIFSKSRLLPFLKNPEIYSKRIFSDEHFNGTFIEKKSDINLSNVLVCRSVKQSTMAENKLLLFQKLASPASNPFLTDIRCLEKILKRNFSNDRKEITEEQLTGKKNVSNENQKISPSRFFLKEQTYNKNHLAFSLKQLKERQPNSGLKLRYASERSDFGKQESRIFAKTITNNVNYGHNILNFIKEDLLDIRTIKDKIKYEPKTIRKERQNSVEPERIPAAKVSDSNPGEVNSSAVIVVPEKLPAVQVSGFDDGLMWARKV